MTKKSLLTLKDYTSEEIYELLNLSEKLKIQKKQGKNQRRLEGKNIALVFEKSSTRTRCAFEVAAQDEGAHVTFLNGCHIGKKESVEDTAKVLGRMYDGIGFRGYHQKTVEDLEKYSGVSVWNALTDAYHPTQILADLLTMKEHIQKPFSEMKFVYIGDARNNMGHSLMIGAVKMGMDFVVIGPKALLPKEDFIKEMKDMAFHTGASITVTSDVSKVYQADAIYTDVWVSMGEEDQISERIQQLLPYQVNMELIRKTENEHVVFMHCLPAFHNTDTQVGKEIFEKHGITEMEVTDEVFKSKYSVVFDEAENRMHTIKAMMVLSLSQKI